MPFKDVCLNSLWNTCLYLEPTSQSSVLAVGVCDLIVWVGLLGLNIGFFMREKAEAALQSLSAYHQADGGYYHSLISAAVTTESYSGPRDGPQATGQEVTSLVIISITLVVRILASVALLLGVVQYRPRLMVPWIILQMMGLVVLVVSGVETVRALITAHHSTAVSILAIYVLVFLLNLVLLKAVYSYYSYVLRFLDRCGTYYSDNVPQPHVTHFRRMTTDMGSMMSGVEGAENDARQAGGQSGQSGQSGGQSGGGQSTPGNKTSPDTTKDSQVTPEGQVHYPVYHDSHTRQAL